MSTDRAARAGRGIAAASSTTRVKNNFLMPFSKTGRGQDAGCLAAPKPVTRKLGILSRIEGHRVDFTPLVITLGRQSVRLTAIDGVTGGDAGGIVISAG